MICRRYEPGADLPAAIRLGADMHAESIYREIPFSVGRVEELDHAIHTNPDLLALICEHDGVAVGFFAGGVSRFYFSEALYGFDFGLYVAKPFRGGSAAVRLLSTFIGWARKRGAIRIQLGVTTGVTPDATARMLRKLGFGDGGNVYALDL